MKQVIGCPCIFLVEPVLLSEHRLLIHLAMTRQINPG
jgi:hypothetical protein